MWRCILVLLFALALGPAPVVGGPAGDPLVAVCQPDQAEVGGPWAGVELHHASLVPSRISLFHPVGNSLDASTDYWTRGRSKVLHLALRVGSDAVIGLDDVRATYRLSPHRLTARAAAGGADVEVGYRFCESLPALVLSVTVTRRSPGPARHALLVGLDTTVKTSHDGTPVTRATTRREPGSAAVVTEFTDARTGPAAVFACPVGGPCTSAAGVGDRAHPGAAFTFDRVLAPGESMSAVLVIGAARPGELATLLPGIAARFEADACAYERRIVAKAREGVEFATGDPVLDRSAVWARAVLAANAHGLDGERVPMPCPAEYNFWFLHDTLLTDLAGVRIDPDRVTADLDHVRRRSSRSGAAPHARYWKDDRFVTEWVGRDSWNHLWMNILPARYRVHGGDEGLLSRLFPVVLRSLGEALTGERDGQISAFRPDWWDCGSSWGARSYMTLLTVHAIDSLMALASGMGRLDARALVRLEETRDRLQAGLLRLWDRHRGYLLNAYAGGETDPHLYIGSLLAVHLGLLPEDRATALMATAKGRLLAPGLGLYNAWPMDFAALERKLHLQAGEEGRPYYYMNGGIWPHGNAWYALGLTALGRAEEALAFVRTVMTLDGVAAGPNGQPAFYEVRNGNPADARERGSVDKPSFLWAAAWYLYVLHDLMGVRDTAWNLAFAPTRPAGLTRCSGPLVVGGRLVALRVEGMGPAVRGIRIDGVRVPSAVVPASSRPAEGVTVELGPVGGPVLTATEARLVRVEGTPGSLSCTLEAFAGHRNRTRIVAPFRPVALRAEGARDLEVTATRPIAGGFVLDLVFTHRTPRVALTIKGTE